MIDRSEEHESRIAGLLDGWRERPTTVDAMVRVGTSVAIPPDPFEIHLANLCAWFDQRWERVDFRCAYIEPAISYNDDPLDQLAEGYSDPKNLPVCRVVAQTWALAVPIPAEVVEDFPGVDFVDVAAAGLVEHAKWYFSPRDEPQTRLYWRRRPEFSCEDEPWKHLTVITLRFRGQFEGDDRQWNKPEGAETMQIHPRHEAGVWTCTP